MWGKGGKDKGEGGDAAAVVDASHKEAIKMLPPLAAASRGELQPVFAT